MRSRKRILPCGKRHFWRAAKQKKGFATFESAIILLGMLLLLFSFIDTCLAVYRHNTLSFVAKDICRYASMRGANFTIDPSEVMGPQEVDGTIVNINQLSEVIGQRKKLFALEEMRCIISWPDGDNQPGDAIRVDIEYPTSPMLPTSNVLFPEFLQSSSQATIQ